jgi:hypothetical protein
LPWRSQHRSEYHGDVVNNRVKGGGDRNVTIIIEMRRQSRGEGSSLEDGASCREKNRIERVEGGWSHRGRQRSQARMIKEAVVQEFGFSSGKSSD